MHYVTCVASVLLCLIKELVRIRISLIILHTMLAGMEKSFLLFQFKCKVRVCVEFCLLCRVLENNILPLVLIEDTIGSSESVTMSYGTYTSWCIILTHAAA